MSIDLETVQNYYHKQMGLKPHSQYMYNFICMNDGNILWKNEQHT